MSVLEDVGRKNGFYFTARELMSRSFPEPRWAVPGLIAEGLTLLVGPPKLGKSWLCLGLAVSVASGGVALGKIAVEAGEVLYAALEDPARRLQNRLDTVLHGSPVPEQLSFITNLPRGAEMIAVLEGWIDAHPSARLVIIDTFAKVRQHSDGRGNQYEIDYAAAGALKSLADRHELAVVIVHHTRKMPDSNDVFNEVSGTTGITGAADAILIAKRGRNTADGVLHVTGRDITEAEYGLTWKADTCSWHLSDVPAAIATMGATRRKILGHLTGHDGDTPAEIAAATRIAPDTVKQTVRRMVTDGQLGTDGKGHYFPNLVSPVSPVSLMAGDGDTGDTGDSDSGPGLHLIPGGVQ